MPHSLQVRWDRETIGWVLAPTAGVDAPPRYRQSGTDTELDFRVHRAELPLHFGAKADGTSGNTAVIGIGAYAMGQRSVLCPLDIRRTLAPAGQADAQSCLYIGWLNISQYTPT